MQFSRYIWLTFYQSLETRTLFWPLITGKTSYPNSTALLIGLTAAGCCLPLSVSMPKDPMRCFRMSVGWYSRILNIALTNLDFWSFIHPSLFFFKFGGHLLSHTVSSAVPSAAWVLTIVFGMGTGVSPRRIATKKSRVFNGVFPSLKRRLSSAAWRGSFEP